MASLCLSYTKVWEGLNLKMPKKVFQPAFGCVHHPKAGQNTQFIWDHVMQYLTNGMQFWCAWIQIFHFSQIWHHHCIFYFQCRNWINVNNSLLNSAVFDILIGSWIINYRCKSMNQRLFGYLDMVHLVWNLYWVI